MPFNDGAYEQLVRAAGGYEGLAEKVLEKLPGLGIDEQTMIRWGTTSGHDMTTGFYDVLHAIADELSLPDICLYDRRQ